MEQDHGHHAAADLRQGTLRERRTSARNTVLATGPQGARVLFHRSNLVEPGSAPRHRADPPLLQAPQTHPAPPEARPALRDLKSDHLRNIERLRALGALARSRHSSLPPIQQIAPDRAESAPLLRPSPVPTPAPTPAPRTPQAQLSAAQREMLALCPPATWLRHSCLPLDRIGRSAMVQIADPADLPALETALAPTIDRLIPLIAPAEATHARLLAHFGPDLVHRAETSVPAFQSCRSFRPDRARAPAVAMLAMLVLCGLVFPAILLLGLWALSIGTLLMFTALRASGVGAAFRRGARPPRVPPPLPDPPLISMLVPLYREAEIGRHLLRRLCRLSYPRARLEVLLILEEHDTVTRHAVACADLPDWFRVVEVPGGAGLTTKPRAMNYALNLCRGDIIGVWDAEDAPEPHQLEQVALAFDSAPADLACLQGVLDFYNPEHNWISRCFSLEYAGWFRVVLPGIARLGLVVPLGGTTMFVRRTALEALGAWDAHNVTEDADLGVRLARAGYRTEMLPTTTFEEANSRALPWIRQRSRWLKGFMMTYLVHMRRPRALLRDLGWRRFAGFQAFFVGTICQFLLAPLLWSFWAMAAGLNHPLGDVLAADVLRASLLALLAFEVVNVVIWIAGARASRRWRLAFWAPVMPLYFVMGCAAAYKALWEVFAAPFFWDKTTHGAHGGAQNTH